MKKVNLSAKRLAVDKANASLIVVVSVSVFIIIFSIIAIRSLYSQLSYQSKVINKKEATLKQVQDNIQEVAKLNIAYQEFASSPENALGGNPKGTGDRDGENARIILDSLPSKYDFPALATSVDKLLKSGGFKATSIEGTDDEVNQSVNTGSVTPQAVDMPFTLETELGVNDGKRFLELFEKSIRPIQLQKLTITAQDNALEFSISAKTYFQPEKRLNVTEEVVK